MMKNIRSSRKWQVVAPTWQDMYVIVSVSFLRTHEIANSLLHLIQCALDLPNLYCGMHAVSLGVHK